MRNSNLISLTSFSSLNIYIKILLTLISLVIVAFGQPAWSGWCSFAAAICGYALFWRVLVELSTSSQRFWAGTLWFTVVQLIQLSWFTAHPYLYIYPIYFLFSFAIGVQYGLLSLLVRSDFLASGAFLCGIAGAWTLSEWLRLFVLSGFTWNPVGLALASNTYSLQMASLVGVYGLSYWVILVNLLALRAWMIPKFAITWIWAALLPYVFGMAHLLFHESRQDAVNTYVNAVVVHTGFPVEEHYSFPDRNSFINFVCQEWCQILQSLKKQERQGIDVMILPEYVVPCKTYSYVFNHESVQNAFRTIFGEESLAWLPPLEPPFAEKFTPLEGDAYFVNNAFWAQGLANYFQTGVIIGLEDIDYIDKESSSYYSTALYLQPMAGNLPLPSYRYEKRILVPMGEYLPFEWCRSFASSYGIYSSFDPGKEAKVFNVNGVLCGLSICYEETFGYLIRENKQRGAEVLINLTNDVWYPCSKLPEQHFYHALLRTVENGFSLIRSSNVGISGAVDSLGRTLASIGHGSTSELAFDSLRIKVPLYTYDTLYSKWGDGFIVGVSALSLICAQPLFRRRVFRKFLGVENV
jgi:apolipoprotein N-acyltransferase